MDRGSNTGRLFLALWPDDTLRAALVAHQAAWTWPATARLTPPQDLHLTLHFIGAVPRARLDDITAGLALPAPRIETGFDRAVLWPRGLAVLLGPPVTASLAALHGNLAQALQRLGLAVDARPYQPHVTLARHAGAAQPPTRAVAPIAWSAQGYVLAVRDGPHYTLLRRYAADA